MKRISSYSLKKGLIHRETWQTSPYIGITVDTNHYIFPTASLAERGETFAVRSCGLQRTLPLPSEVYAVVHHERGVATVRRVKDKKRIQAAMLGLACMLRSDLSDLVRRCRTTVKDNGIPFPPRLDDYARCGTTGNAPIVTE